MKAASEWAEVIGRSARVWTLYELERQIKRIQADAIMHAVRQLRAARIITMELSLAVAQLKAKAKELDRKVK